MGMDTIDPVHIIKSKEQFLLTLCLITQNSETSLLYPHFKDARAFF